MLYQPQGVYYADADEGDGHTGDQYTREEFREGFLDGKKGPSGAFDDFSENVGDEDTGKDRDHHDLDLDVRDLLVECGRVQHQDKCQGSPSTDLTPPIVFAAVCGHAVKSSVFRRFRRSILY